MEDVFSHTLKLHSKLHPYVSFSKEFVINLTIVFLLDPWQSGYTISDWPSINTDIYLRLSAKKQSEQ